MTAYDVANHDDTDGALHQLLRSAVTLQAEDLMRTIGALAKEQQDVRGWSGHVERDVRDLAMLASCAVAVGARLPAGMDDGGGDPDDPSSVLEGLLASHQALVRVLGQLARQATDPRMQRIVADVLTRREEESTMLRALGAGTGLPAEERLVHGALPKYQR